MVADCCALSLMDSLLSFSSTAAMSMSESSTYIIADIVNSVRVIADKTDTPTVLLSKYANMTQLIATNIGDAAPLPWTAPCNGFDGVPQ